MEVPNFYLNPEVHRKGKASELAIAFVLTTGAFLSSFFYYWYKVDCIYVDVSLGDTEIKDYLDDYCGSLKRECDFDCGCSSFWISDELDNSGCRLSNRSSCSNDLDWLDKYGDGCDWYYEHDPTCSQVSDLGQYLACPEVCNTCLGYCWRNSECGNYFTGCDSDTPTYYDPSKFNIDPSSYTEHIQELENSVRILGTEHLSFKLLVPPVFKQVVYQDAIVDYVTNNICLQSRRHQSQYLKDNLDYLVGTNSFYVDNGAIKLQASYNDLGNSGGLSCLNVSFSLWGGGENYSPRLSELMFYLEQPSYFAHVCDYGQVIESISLSIPLSSFALATFSIIITKIRHHGIGESKDCSDSSGQ